MHIAITTLPGYNLQEKKLLAKTIKKAIATMGILPVTISVSIRDLPLENWDEFIRKLSDDEIIVPEVCNDCQKSY